MPYHPQTVVFGRGWFDESNPIRGLPEPCYLLVDTHDHFSHSLPNVYIQVEPQAISPLEGTIIANKDRYALILTFNQRILDSCPNAIEYIHGTTWIEKGFYESVDISKKAFAISTLASTKNVLNAPGHLLRKAIHANQPLFEGLPITFFRSSHQQPPLHDYGGNPFLGKSKVELFENFQFAIVIENSRQTNYFTEKLMDCLLTKTIPIYWGCPNVEKFFDTTGWIVLNTTRVEDIRQALSLLEPSYYARFASTVEKNYETAKQWVSFYENISKACEANLNKGTLSSSE
jgi:hypothetical protein